MTGATFLQLVVGGLTMGSRASKARKTTWKNIVDLGQMDGLG